MLRIFINARTTPANKPYVEMQFILVNIQKLVLIGESM